MSSVTFTSRRVRLEADASGNRSFVDKITSAKPRLPRASDVSFEVMILFGGNPVNVGDWISLTLDVKEKDGLEGLNVMSKTVGSDVLIPNADVTLAEWLAQTGQHAVMEFSAAETDLDFAEDSRTYNLSLYAITSFDTGSKKIVIGNVDVIFYEAGEGGDAPVTPFAPTYLTREAADALYELKFDTSTLTALVGTATTAAAAASAAAAAAQTTANAAMPKAGGAFTGLIVLSADPSANLNPVSKQYGEATYLLRNGTLGQRTMSNELILNSSQVSGGAPVAGSANTVAASQGFVTASINALVAAAPGALDTLKELADAIGDDANFSTTINTALAARLKIDGTVAMTGDLTLKNVDPSSGNHATRKSYVDALNNLRLPLAGGTVTGVIQFSGYQNAGIKLSNIHSADVVTPLVGMFIWETDGWVKVYDSTQWLKMVTESFDGTISATGTISSGADPSTGNHLARLTWINANLAKLAGATFTGDLTFSGAANGGLRVANIAAASVGTPLTGHLIWDTGFLKAYNSTTFKQVVMQDFADDLNIASTKVYKIDGTQVCGPRQSAIPDMDHTTIAVAHDQEARDSINTILAMLRSNGNIAP